MLELINIFNLPFEIQGVARYNNQRIVIDGCFGSYTDINYNCAVVCYLRSEDNTTYSNKQKIGCNEFIYDSLTTMYLVVLDQNYKYNLESLKSNIISQLMNNDITVLRSSFDFNLIKDEERLTEIKDGQLLKFTFNYKQTITSNCEEIICNC